MHTQALLAERERELADSRREALEADARHAIDQTTIHELSMVGGRFGWDAGRAFAWCGVRGLHHLFVPFSFTRPSVSL